VAVLGIILNVQDYTTLAGVTATQRATDLLVLELDHFIITADDLIPFVLGSLEKLRKCKPLSSHLVSIICVDKLVVVDAVRRVPFDSLLL
jgi:hypothetical protein